MICELISVGTELLLGNIVNTNTQFLAEKCALLGLSLYHQVTVGDNRERLTQVIRTALERADILILTGGLGPTEDDLTKEVCAEAMGFSLAEDPHTRKRIEEYFRNSIYKEIPDNNWKQAIVPDGSIVLDNDNGTAPGLILEKDGKRAILLPGPPGELYPLFEKKVVPYLQKLQPEVILSQMVKICGYGESQVEDKLLDLIDGQTNPTIATYAKTGEVHLRVTARAKETEQAKKLLKPVVKEIKSRFADAVYTTKEEESLEEADGGVLEVQRNDLAQRFNCVPSQINYVMSTRFSPERGYIVESRRGGNGYIRITRVRVDRQTLLMQVINTLGSQVDLASARAILNNLVQAGALEENAGRSLLAAVGDKALAAVPRESRDTVRADIMKQVLILQV